MGPRPPSGGGGFSWPAAPWPCPCVHLCCRYTGTTPSPPPGSHYTSPSENMWNTGSTYNLSSGMTVTGEQVPLWGYVWRSHFLVTPTSTPWVKLAVLAPGTPNRTLSPPLTSPSLDTGMPTAYDLSSVISGGSSVGHNNLIPLGECPWVWGVGGGFAAQDGPCAWAFCITFSSSWGSWLRSSFLSASLCHCCTPPPCTLVTV